MDVQLRLGEVDNSADDDRTDDNFAYSEYVHDGGTGSYIPDALAAGRRDHRFNLHSPTSSTTSGPGS